ncbi:MAG: MBL fold metallo-hydrolase RNA specificity domain-containing protein [Gemmatimonadota bacterium]
MRIQFWGAARTVTGSMHLLEANGRRILLDCGLYQGKRKEAFERNRSLPFDPAEIDAVLLSHAHIDHCGNLPGLVRGGFRGRIYTTGATRDLAALLLLDSAKIQASDLRRTNRLRVRRGKKPFEPLYVEEDVVRTLKRFVTVDYEEPCDLFPGIRAHFVDAGHMLGSASVAVDLEDGDGSRRLLFSGDIGRRGVPILRDPQVVDGVDVTIMESTYGDRLHEPAEEADEMLCRVIGGCCEGDGKLLVPSFAVGRTQELAYRLNGLWEAGRLPPIPVYVDTPLGVKATDVYRLHPECFDEEMLEALRTEEDSDPLGFEKLTYIRSSQESKRLNGLRAPAIIIAPSGMCEGGRIVHHLVHHIERESTTILFVGFQAAHTLGRRILDGVSPVRIFDGSFEVRARVTKGGSFSGHADRDGLLRWADEVRSRGAAGRFFLVHGEEESALALAGHLRKRGIPEVAVPERGAAFDLP